MVVLIIFPVILQIDINVIMLSIGRRGGAAGVLEAVSFKETIESV